MGDRSGGSTGTPGGAPGGAAEAEAASEAAAPNPRYQTRRIPGEHTPSPSRGDDDRMSRDRAEPAGDPPTRNGVLPPFSMDNALAIEAEIADGMEAAKASLAASGYPSQGMAPLPSLQGQGGFAPWLAPPHGGTMLNDPTHQHMLQQLAPQQQQQQLLLQQQQQMHHQMQQQLGQQIIYMHTTLTPPAEGTHLLVATRHSREVPALRAPLPPPHFSGAEVKGNA